MQLRESPLVAGGGVAGRLVYQGKGMMGGRTRSVGSSCSLSRNPNSICNYHSHSAASSTSCHDMTNLPASNWQPAVAVAVAVAIAIAVALAISVTVTFTVTVTTSSTIQLSHPFIKLADMAAFQGYPRFVSLPASPATSISCGMWHVSNRRAYIMQQWRMGKGGRGLVTFLLYHRPPF